MRALRRLLQIVALVGTLLVGILAVALIVSQTPWFRDWLRRYIVRESKQYVNGELSIGRLGGNLFFGVQLQDIALDVSGERVVSVKDVELDYSIFTILARGVVLDEIKLAEPRVILERDADGWNLARIVKKQEKEADREGPGAPLSLPSIQVTDAHVAIRDQAVGTSGFRMPEEIRDLDVKVSYEYEPVRYTLTFDHASFRATSPDLTLGQLTGTVAVRDDNVYIEGLRLATAESHLAVDGVVEDYLRTPIVKVTTTGQLSVPEIGRIVPAAEGYDLHPTLDIKANGPAERLGLDLDVRTEAGNVRGQLTADVEGPAMGAEGRLQIERLNLAPLLKDPSQRSDITANARLDIDVAGAPESAPITDRLSGTFAIDSPRLTAAGYQATGIDLTGRIDGPRMTIDGRAGAYGGTATAKGTLVLPGDGRPLSFDLAGGADDINLRSLPAALGVPRLATELSVARYEIRGTASAMEGRAALNRSTVEGATIAEGTVAEFSLQPRAISYSARGEILNLDVARMGRAFEVDALAKPEYESVVNSTFDVKGSMPRTPAPRKGSDSALATMTLEASGALKDTGIMGGRLPGLDYQVQIAEGALTGSVNGAFEGFDPSRITGREDVKGTVSGTVNANVAVADLTAPIGPEAIRADGQVTLGESTVGGLQIESLDLQADYADQVADVKTLTLDGPDVRAAVSGRVSLDDTTPSDLKYRVEAINIPELAKLAGQEGIGGAATLEGTVTGTRAVLTTTGTLDGSNLSFQENSALDLNSDYTVTVPDLDFARARVEAATQGEFIKAGGLEITQLDAKTTYDQKTIEFSTTIQEKTRELDASGSVILHPDHQEIHLPNLALRTQGVEWRTAPGSDAAIQYGQNQVQLDGVSLVSGDQSLTVDGTIALKDENPSAALDVTATNVDLQQLQQLLLMDRGLSGRLSAKARLTGTTESPTVDGHVEIHDGGFQAYKYESLIADVDYTGRSATIDATLTQTPEVRVTVQGNVPVSLFQGSDAATPAPAEPVDLRITSSAIDLGIVQAFTTAIADVTGTLQADLRVTGTGEDPRVVGFVDIRNAGFGLPLGGVSYSGLNTRIDFTPDRVTLENFQITDEEGATLTVSGDVAVQAKRVGAFNIAIRSDNFEVIDNELGDVGVETDLRITGELSRPRVEGSVRVQAGRLEVDEILALFYDPYATESIPEVVSAERTVEGGGSAEEATRAALRKAEAPAARGEAEKTAADAAPAPGGIFENLTLDVSLVIPQNLVLRGDDLRPGGPTGAAIGDINLTIGGDIQARKDPGGPVRLTGIVETVRGTYEFQGRRFDLERGGRLRFAGTPDINPILDIRASRVIPNTGVEARIQISGTAKAPELTLTSNPPLDESDILALIVFNRPVNELGTGERSSLAATAGGIATGFIAAPLGESIGRALDLDLFEITTTNNAGELGAGVTLGQQIGDRAFIRLRQEFGDRNTSEFMVEYQLARFLRLEVSAAPQTSGSGNRITQRRVERAGIDLIFFFSY